MSSYGMKKTIITPQGSRLILKDDPQHFGTANTNEPLSNGCLLFQSRDMMYPVVMSGFIKPENRSELCDKIAAFLDNDTEDTFDLRLEPLAKLPIDEMADAIKASGGRLKPGDAGDWMLISDSDAHKYIIPAGEEEDFVKWVEYMETGGTEPKLHFDQYKCGWHPSCYTFTGYWKVVQD